MARTHAQKGAALKGSAGLAMRSTSKVCLSKVVRVCILIGNVPFSHDGDLTNFEALRIIFQRVFIAKKAMYSI